MEIPKKNICFINKALDTCHSIKEISLFVFSGINSEFLSKKKVVQTRNSDYTVFSGLDVIYNNFINRFLDC